MSVSLIGLMVRPIRETERMHRNDRWIRFISLVPLLGEYWKRRAFSMDWKANPSSWTSSRFTSQSKSKRGRKPPRHARPSPSERWINTHLAVGELLCSNSRYSTNQTSLVSPTQRFSGASPQNKIDLWGGLALIAGRWAFCFGSPAWICGRGLPCFRFSAERYDPNFSLSIKPRGMGGALGRLNEIRACNLGALKAELLVCWDWKARAVLLNLSCQSGA